MTASVTAAEGAAIYRALQAVQRQLNRWHPSHPWTSPIRAGTWGAEIERVEAVYAETVAAQDILWRKFVSERP